MLIQTQAMEIQGTETTALLIGAIDRNPASVRVTVRRYPAAPAGGVPQRILLGNGRRRLSSAGRVGSALPVQTPRMSTRSIILAWAIRHGYLDVAWSVLLRRSNE
jgi:hypothetical protein